jgi:hypothetical protein
MEPSLIFVMNQRISREEPSQIFVILSFLPRFKYDPIEQTKLATILYNETPQHKCQRYDNKN